MVNGNWRWDFPPPQGYAPMVNIRNVKSPFWPGWLKPEYRCLVAVTSFSEYAPEPDPRTGRKDIVWFSLDESRPLFAFAGLWRPWTGTRGTKAKSTEGDLTTEPNAVMKPPRVRRASVVGASGPDTGYRSV